MQSWINYVSRSFVNSSLSDKLAVIAAALFIISIISFGALQLLFSIYTHQAAKSLRTPTQGWKKVVGDVLDGTNSSKRLPSQGRSTAALRRQLIKRSRTPRLYSTQFGADRINLADESKDLLDLSPKNIIYGFFHPNANAGGGGERVLWAAIMATLEESPDNVAAIYASRTPSQWVSRNEIFSKVKARFGFDPAAVSDRIVFLMLSNNDLIDPSRYPHFTLLGQAIGSIILAKEAVSTLVPDVFIDTMGLPFCYPYVSWFTHAPICAYVHYPVVSRDMINAIGPIFALQNPVTSLLRILKFVYWSLLMVAYAFVGTFPSVIMVNSTWTQNHIKRQWCVGVQKSHIKIVYPPVAVEDFESDQKSPHFQDRNEDIVCIAQFRPEKRHDLLLKEFAKFKEASKSSAHLILIGSIRENADKSFVYALRLLCRELGLSDTDDVKFLVDCPWDNVRDVLRKSDVGVNTMWNEHFGMVVVEYMAAGMIPIAHNSAGPKLDIVGEGEHSCGFLFTSNEDPDYWSEDASLTLHEAFALVSQLSKEDKAKLRIRAVEDSKRFSDEAFATAWKVRLSILFKLQNARRLKRLSAGLYD